MVPERWKQAEDKIQRLTENLGSAKAKFEDLIEWYRAKQITPAPSWFPRDKLKEMGLDAIPSKIEMTSSYWCLLWDDLFFPPTRLASFREKMLKDVIVPRYCR